MFKRYQIDVKGINSFESGRKNMNPHFQLLFSSIFKFLTLWDPKLNLKRFFPSLTYS